MKTFVRHAVALLAVTVVCQGSLALAEDYYWVTGGGQAATSANDEKVAKPAQSDCAACDPASCCPEESCGCGSCCPGLGLGCDAYPPRGIVGFAGFDSFKGVSDGTFQSNFGAVAGVNSALGLGNRGIGWQLGVSYGVYDFDGRSTLNQATSQQQIFVTTGFFRKARGDQRLSFGIVYDWMCNDQWGIYATSPTLGQWRGQVEWATSGSNAFGMYGCVRDLASAQAFQGAVVQTRGISQVNLFWHHKFEMGAHSHVWVGGVQTDRLNGQGSLGDAVIGASFEVPVSDRLALYGNAQYMHPSAVAGTVAAVEEGYNVGMGLAWYFGGHARSNRINGKCGLPYMPVANNSTFMVDQNLTQ